MPEFKKYSGIKACEDFTQRCDPTNSATKFSTRAYRDITGYEYTALSASYLSNAGGRAKKYLQCDTIKASADEYDADDYNGTSTGTCTFTKNASTGGIAYQIEFTATETATIRCFKFYKNISAYTTTQVDVTLLMFAIYLDTPISVTAGDVLNMSINFAYDEVTVI